MLQTVPLALMSSGPKDFVVDIVPKTLASKTCLKDRMSVSRIVTQYASRTPQLML